MISTIQQLSKNAKDYYNNSVSSKLFEYVFVNIDYFGRKVYQLYFDNELYGQPKALLTYREFANKVKNWNAKYPHTPIGIERWTKPYYE